MTDSLRGYTYCKGVPALPVDGIEGFVIWMLAPVFFLTCSCASGGQEMTGPEAEAEG